jgi:hypothetical protein
MASKINALPLNELYSKKITASVEAAIHAKEDFSKISKDYCTHVCQLKCKKPERVLLLTKPVDILIIQDHAMPKGKYDRTDDQSEKVQQNIIEFICEKAGFQGLTYRLVNLLKCAPNEQDFPKGKAPTAVKLYKCKPYLLAEIERCKPKVIISLSTAVTKALGFKKHSNTGNRGEIVNGNVIITLHPRVLSMIRQNASGAMWGNDYFEVIRRDFEKAARIARGEITIIPLEKGIEKQKKNIKICQNLEDVRQVVETIMSLPDGYLISCDTETTGLDPMAEDAKLLCIQFGWKDEKSGEYVAAVIPLWHRLNTRYNPGLAWKLVIPILLSPNILKVLHNGKFDILYIYHTTGVRMEGFEMDTMLLLHAKDSGTQGCMSLKTAMWDYCLELGISGYEDLLPKLTKKNTENDEVNEEDEFEE